MTTVTLALPRPKPSLNAEDTLERLKSVARNHPIGDGIAITDYEAGGIKAAGVESMLRRALGGRCVIHAHVPHEANRYHGATALGEQLFVRHDLGSRLVVVDIGDPADSTGDWGIFGLVFRYRPDIAVIAQINGKCPDLLSYLKPHLEGIVRFLGEPGPHASMNRIPEIIASLRVGGQIETEDANCMFDLIPAVEWPTLEEREVHGQLLTELKISTVKRTSEGHVILNCVLGQLMNAFPQLHHDQTVKVSTIPFDLGSSLPKFSAERITSNTAVVSPSEFVFYTTPTKFAEPGRDQICFMELRGSTSNRGQYLKPGENLPKYYYFRVV